MNVRKYAAPNGALFLVLLNLQLCRAYGADSEVMERIIRLIKIALPLAIVSVCLSVYVLNSQSGIIREFQAALLSLQWMLLVCLAVWCGTFLFLTFNLKDLPLIGLLLIAIAAYFTNYAASSFGTDAIILLFGVTLGRGTCFALREDGRWKMEDGAEKEVGSQKSEVRLFLIGLIALLAFASWWHLDMADNYYHGPRWMGLWDNPNIYGILMGAGTTLAIALQVLSLKSKVQSPKLNKAKIILLSVAIFMMGVGLVFSYSRGAWVGTAIGLLYMATAYGMFKWRSPKFFLFSAFCFLLLIFGVCFFWHGTSDTAPWYLKRMDLSRPSAQHRVAAWLGAVQMMRDHPFGVGWNNAVGVYNKNYSPPEGGAAAITMNDYLMLGTQLGIPGLLCFVAYVGLCFRKVGRASRLSSERVSASIASASPMRAGETPALLYACRAGAVTMLVAFWFDGGLFKLATASVFWTLLELGSSEMGVDRWQIGKNGKQKEEMGGQSEIRNPQPDGGRSILRSIAAIKSSFVIRKSAIGESLVTPAATKQQYETSKKLNCK
jgi:hypothetical protein